MRKLSSTIANYFKKNGELLTVCFLVSIISITITVFMTLYFVSTASDSEELTKTIQEDTSELQKATELKQGAFSLETKWLEGRMYYRFSFGDEFYKKQSSSNREDYNIIIHLKDADNFTMNEIKINRNDLIKDVKNSRIYFDNSIMIDKAVYKNINTFSLISNYLFDHVKTVSNRN